MAADRPHLPENPGDQQFSRSEILLGTDSTPRLKACRVAVLGLGGVGSWCAEALCRSGIGELVLIDKDSVELSNLNRQLPASHATLGQAKATVLVERFRKICPEHRFEARQGLYLAEQRDILFDERPYDFIVDCVDNLSAKLDLVLEAERRSLPLISSLGTGNRLDPGAFYIGSLWETSYDPLARNLRQALRKRQFSGPCTVLASHEIPRKSASGPPGSSVSGPVGSLPFVPPAAGFLIASWVVRRLLGLVPPDKRRDKKA